MLITQKTHLVALGTNLILLAINVLMKQREQKTLRSIKKGNLLYNITWGVLLWRMREGNMLIRWTTSVILYEQ